MLRLRDYQSGAINALNAKFDEDLRRVAVVLPTGGGKTVVFSHLSTGYVTRNPGKRVLILAHTDELVRQAAKKLKDVAPDLSVGIVKGPIRQTKATVVVASVQSLRDPKKRNQIQSVGMVIVDECHHATAKTYVDILRHYGALGEACVPCDGTGVDPAGACPECKGSGELAGTGAVAAGFTATLMRSDKASLARIWQDVAYKKDISFMIRAGYLLPPRGKRIVVDDLDLAKVKKSGGDFQASDLGEALEASLAPETVAKAYAEHASDRSGVLFAPTVEAAYTFAEELNAVGITTEVVHGALETKERRAILSRLESGETQVVANCMVLTEGFDCPRVSCVVVARPTKSAPLYQQMVGRGLRIDPTRPREGQDCLILDVVGVSANHTLASLVDLSEKQIIVRDGQTLIEAEDELAEKEESFPIIPDFHEGPVVALDFDPLAANSSRVWMKTGGGIYFLSAGTQDGVYVFVIPATKAKCEACGGAGEFDYGRCYDCGETGWQREDDGSFTPADPGTYDVLWCTKDAHTARNGQRGGVTNHRGLSLELAFAWGEDTAQEMGGESGSLTLNKASSWRKTKPSDKQLAMCRRFGLVVPEGASKGEVSALIDTHFASKRIDPIARYFAQQS
jgi:superfamily II DNA or RNA helicase